MLSARRLWQLLLAALLLAACSAPATSTANPSPSNATPVIHPSVTVPVNSTPEVASTAVIRSAQLSELQNNVQAMRQAGEPFVAAREGDVVVVGGRVSTGAASKVRLDLTEGTIVRLGAETEFTVEALTQDTTDPFTRLKLLTGQLWVILNGGSLEVETPVGVAAVRGSYLGVSFDPQTQRLEVTCLEGQCGLSNDAGEVELTDGQSSEIVGDEPPAPIEELTYEEIQEWIEENPEAEAIVEEVYPEGTPTPNPETENADSEGDETNNEDGGGGSSSGSDEVGSDLQYSIGNICQESITVTYSGPVSGSFTVAPGETQSGELPPGEYVLTNSRDNEPLVWNSANGPLTGSFCDDGGSAGGGGNQPPLPNTEPLRYALTHNCPADPETGLVREGVWEWTFENLTTGQTYNVSVNPGESQSGELPPGRYRVSDRDATGPLTSGEIDSGGPGINVARCGSG